MLNFLFPRLTAQPAEGAALFDAITAEARQPHWFVEGQVPDTIDGRFRVLATLVALVTVRLESAAEGQAGSVALIERFVEVMESEHRELGLGDPGLGRKVQKLVGSLAGRVQLWRGATAGSGSWEDAVGKSLYPDGGDDEAVAHSGGALQAFWAAAGHARPDALMQGVLR